MPVITSLDEVSEYPLVWPDSRPRTAHRERSKFKATLAVAHRLITDEMTRWRINNAYTVSMAPAFRRGTTDPGCALWFLLPLKRDQIKRELRVIACDGYDLQEHNLYAIGKTLEALRAIERWGAYSLEQAVEGARPQLPPPSVANAPPWRAIFGVPPGLRPDHALAIVEKSYRTQALEAQHDQARSVNLNLAVEAARKELRT